MSLFRCAAALLGVVTTAAAAPFAWNGWQFHERNLPKLEEAIARAPEYGVNFVVFSHELFRHIERILADPSWVAELNRAGAAAQKQKIPFYLWIHELNEIPDRFLVDGRAQLDDPALQTYLDDRYERLLRAIPGTAGFVLTFHETSHHVFRDSRVASRLSVPERIALVTRTIHRVCQRHGLKLIVRNFFYEPYEMQWFQDAMRLLPDDVIVMRKDTTHEFNPFYPPDPFHGQSGRTELIELDLGVEKALGYDGPYAQTAFLRKMVNRARDRRLAGAMGRVRLLADRPFDDLHEVNLYTFARFMADPALAPETVLRDWAARRYPAEAVPFLVSALQRTEFIHHHGRYHLGWWFTKWIGEDWDDYAYYFGRARLRSNAKWTQDPRDAETEKLIYAPTPDFYRRVLAEKDEVLRAIAAGTAEVERAAVHLTPEQARVWRDGYRALDDAVTLLREWVRAYFAHRIFLLHGDTDFRAIARDALARLEELDRDPSRPWGRVPDSPHRYFIDKFALELRWRMANRTRALKDDERILADAAKLIAPDVAAR